MERSHRITNLNFMTYFNNDTFFKLPPNFSRLWFSAMACAFLGAPLCAPAATVRLDELDLAAMNAGWGKPQPNRAITQKPLAIGGVKFAHGVGTHAESYVTIQLDGKATSFSAKVGVDDGASNAVASVEFIVTGDDRELWRSGVCKRRTNNTAT